MTPRQLVSCIDFRYITDALTPDEARRAPRASGARRKRIARRSCRETAIPPTRPRSAGWAIPTTTSAALCREALADGWTHFKVKVGGAAGRRSRGASRWCARRSDRRTADDRREPAVGRRRGDRARPALAPSTVVDRRADEPGRRARARDDCQGGARRHRRRDRRALRQPRSSSSSCCRRRRSTSARSTAAGWAA